MNTSFTCPVCSNRSFDQFTDYKNKTQSKPFMNKQLRKCAKCGLLSIHPMPTEKELNSYYLKYWENESNDNLRNLQKKQAMARMNFLRSYINPKKNKLTVLDFGVGFGDIKAEMENTYEGMDISYDAVEIDPTAIKILKKTVKPRNIYRNIDNCKEKYSFVFMFHILEHLISPKSILKSIKKHMEKSGLIFIEVPNNDNLYKLYNEPHLIFFNADSLKKLLETSGFRVFCIKSCGLDIKVLNETMKNVSKKRIFFADKIFYLKQKLSYHLLRLFGNADHPAPDHIALLQYGYKNLIDSYIANTETYGKNRQWIRLIAQKKD